MLPKLTDDTHGIWCRNDHIEIHVAGLNLLTQVFETDQISTCGSSLFCIIALGKYRHADCFPGTVGQRTVAPRTTLVRFSRIDS